MNRAELLACPECDLLQSDSAFPRPRKALCARCGAILYQRHDHGLERTAALTVAAAVLFAMANVFPIVSLELQGDRTTATLIRAICGREPPRCDDRRQPGPRVLPYVPPRLARGR